MPRILIVDDEEDFVHLIDMVLTKEKYDVVIASTGEEALAELEKGAPDLVVLDLNLPGIDGFQVCKKIREKYSFTDVPILMLTVRTLEQDHISGLACGSDDYMVKPFQPKELLARARMLLRRAGKPC